MGCVASRIDKEERVRICKERKRLMKQLIGYRREFADAQLAYLRALKNTGVTLRQFTESDKLEFDDVPFRRSVLPPSPPPPLPPSPPPPPTFSPDSRTFESKEQVESAQEEIIEIDEDTSSNTPPPPPVLSSSWELWDPFGPSSSPNCDKRSETVGQVEEENWEETNTEFVEEDEEVEREEGHADTTVADVLAQRKQAVELLDDDSSVTSWHTKDTSDMAMVLWRSKKTLAGVVRELDDYFLKASAGGKGIAILMDINVDDTFPYQSIKENKRKRCNSSKVFTALTWSWSSKSLQSTRDAGIPFNLSEPCKPGAHCQTLKKLHAEEQKLYKEVKEEEIMKTEHERKSLALQKQEEEDHDWNKIEKTRSSVESMQADILSLQQSISRTCSSILKLIDEELHPQLIALASGLMHMWQTMYECHQVQNHLASQQLNHLASQQSMDPTSEYHRQATAQLKSEVSSWYSSFCDVVRSQRDYVRTLCTWIQLTERLVDDGQLTTSSSAVFSLSAEWLLALDKLPDKIASEAIKSLLSAINSIVLQQEQENRLKRKTEKLERRLQRELSSLAEMEMKLEGSFIEDANTGLVPKHPLSVKRAKVEVLKKQVHDGKARYTNSIQFTKAMILNNLQTSLPNVFRALMAFSSTYTQSFQAVLSSATPVEHEDETVSPIDL